MNRLAVIIGLVVIGFGPLNPLSAQDESTEQLKLVNAYKYQKGVQYSDYEVAKNALYSLMALDPQNDSLKYTLAVFYLETNRFASATLVGLDMLSTSPDFTGAIEVCAVSYEQLGIKDKAAEYYEKLYLKTQNIPTLYKLAFLQYELQRFKESDANADIILESPVSDSLSVVYNIEEEQKEFTFKVAILNLKGLILREQGDKEKASDFFKQALELAPDFTLARQNLDGLKEEED